jgi:hypothetical protein
MQALLALGHSQGKCSITASEVWRIIVIGNAAASALDCGIEQRQMLGWALDMWVEMQHHVGD